MWSAELFTSNTMKVTDRHLMNDGTRSVNSDATVNIAHSTRATLSPERQRSRHEVSALVGGNLVSQRKQTVSSLRMVPPQLEHLVIYRFFSTKLRIILTRNCRIPTGHSTEYLPGGGCRTLAG